MRTRNYRPGQITNCSEASILYALYPPHHVPYVVSQPVDDRVAATDKLQVFGLCGFLCNKEYHKAGWHKRHGNNDEDSNHYICPLEPVDTGEERGNIQREIIYSTVIHFIIRNQLEQTICLYFVM